MDTKTFPWEPPHLKAATLLAEDELTDQEIATTVGVCRATLAVWKKHPEFAKRVQEVKVELGDVFLRYAIGRRLRRIRRLEDNYCRLQAVRDARAADMQGVPGGASGFLVRQFKTLGKGASAVVKEEYVFDAALERAMRELLKQAAMESGQWQERRDVTTANEPMTLIRGVPDEQL